MSYMVDSKCDNFLLKLSVARMEEASVSTEVTVSSNCFQSRDPGGGRRKAAFLEVGGSARHGFAAP